MRRTQIHLFLIVLIIGFLTGPRAIQALQLIGNSLGQNSPQSAQVVASTPVQPTQTTVVEVKRNPFAHLNIKAKSIYVWDINEHKKLYGVNEHTTLPLASVTKMMMAVVAKELLPGGNAITIRADDILLDGDTGLRVGEKWTLDELLKFTLVASSNDGASAIASVAGATLAYSTTTNVTESKRLFIDKMNKKAQDIGLTSTRFYNESGLDLESLTSGAHGSARDMAMLFEYVFRKYPELFTPTSYASIDITSESNIVHQVANTNQSVKHIGGIIGSKTGFTTLAGGNLVVIIDIGINHPVVIAVLGSTYDGRFADVEQLITATVEEITSTTAGG